MAASRVRLAAVADAPNLARMLRDFNSEFETPTPSVHVLTERVSALLSQAGTYAVVAEEAPTGSGSSL